MECTIPAGYNWAAGNWTIPIQIISGDMDVTLEEIHICEVNADYSNVGSIASSLAIGRAINTAQVESFTVTQSAAVPGATGDHIIIIMAFSEAGGHATGNVTWAPTQTITAPGTVFAVAGSSTRRWISPDAGVQIMEDGVEEYIHPAAGVQIQEDQAVAVTGRPPLSAIRQQAPFRSSFY